MKEHFKAFGFSLYVNVLTSDIDRALIRTSESSATDLSFLWFLIIAAVCVGGVVFALVLLQRNGVDVTVVKSMVK